MLLAACQPSAPEERSSSTATGEDNPSSTTNEKAMINKNLDALAAAEVLKNSDVTILDVRTPEEYRRGHLKGAVNINFHAADFKDNLAKLDHDKPYLVHCKSGGRSSKTMKILKQMEFTKLYHLDGGYDAWVKADQPIVEAVSE